ncbi:protealysin inhibitor emfourin [Chloroflexus aurantiacus]|uniref:protealysin inhibitor emfourin n=1 Tax=Chloroflexus aurantiacus TaxID=1108 RepID=UPI0000459014|nr:protealysin inhibitor emfourin [Chloroflexus aurantiacus]
MAVCFLLFLLSIAGCAFASVQPRKAKALIFTRSGGFAGVSDELTIDLETGTAHLQNGKEIRTTTLSQEQRTRLQALIAGLDLSSLPATPSQEQCCDLLMYRIQIDTVVIQTTDGEIPPALQPLIAELNVIVSGMLSQ